MLNSINNDQANEDLMPFLCTFAFKSSVKVIMTQKEAIIKALEELGGRAHLHDIYPRVIKLAEFKADSDKAATIRTTMQRHPKLFRPSEGKKGWWELTSYQEEIAQLRARIAELETENERLRNRETVDVFVKRFVETTKKICFLGRKNADIIRQVLEFLGRDKEGHDLQMWILDKPKTTRAGASKSIIQHNINSQVFIGDIKDSEFKGTSSNGKK